MSFGSPGESGRLHGRGGAEEKGAARPIFQLRGVKKSFGGKPILNGVDFDLAVGDTVSLLGPSGCGKTVLLKCMIGLMTIDRGDILFDGISVPSMNPVQLLDLRRRVGLMFQYNALFDSMTVADNIAYGLREQLSKPMTPEEIDDRVAWALECVALPGTQELHPHELSGGMRKRVGLSRTMALHPEVILYDEPTMGLDPINTHRIGSLITGLHATYHMSGVMVTHDMKLAFSVGNRVAMMLDGAIIGEGTTDEMRDHPDVRVRDFIAGRVRDEEV